MHDLSTKYRSVKVINDQETVDEMWAGLIAAKPDQVKNWQARSAHAGRAVLYRNELFPGKVLEYISDINNDTSVTTLYAGHPIFASRQSIIDAREEIIREIDVHFQSVPNVVTVKDGGRGDKEFFLVEMGTAQLIDLLGMFSGKTIKLH